MSQKDHREKEIKDEKDKTKELDLKLKEWEKKLKIKRKEVGGANAGANFAAHSKKQEKIFENRLDHVSPTRRLNLIRTAFCLTICLILWYRL